MESKLLSLNLLREKLRPCLSNWFKWFETGTRNSAFRFLEKIDREYLTKFSKERVLKGKKERDDFFNMCVE